MAITAAQEGVLLVELIVGPSASPFLGMAGAVLPTRDLVDRVKQRPTDDNVLRVSFFCGRIPLLAEPILARP